MSKSGIKSLRGIDEELWHRMKIEALKEGKTIAQYLNQVLRDKLPIAENMESYWKSQQSGAE